MNDEDKYQHEVHSEVWHLDGKVECIDIDQVSYYYSIGLSPQEAARREVERSSPHEEDELNKVRTMLYYCPHS